MFSRVRSLEKRKRGSVIFSTGRDNESNKGPFTHDARELVPWYLHIFVIVYVFVSFSSAVRRQ